MDKYVVSACLVGKNTKYNGGNNRNEKIIEFLKDKEYILICPEVSGGLSIPRPPSEIVNNKVIKIPNTPLVKPIIKLSLVNTRLISLFDAPILRNTPISFVRSITEI